MNAPVLALIGQIPQNAIRRDLGHLHEIRDQAGILDRLVDHVERIPRPADAPRLVATAIASMSTDRPGPAALECAMDVWGRVEPVREMGPLAKFEPPVDDEAVEAAAKLLGAAKNPMIVCGGGAQDAAKEVARLSAMLQAPVLGYRRGRGLLDSRDPLSITLPLAHEMWREVDVVIGVGSRLLQQLTVWGADQNLKVIRLDADPDEPERAGKPQVSLIGDAAPILHALIKALPKHNTKRKPRKAEMEERQAKLKKRLARLVPQMAILDVIRAELPEDGIFVDEVTQIGFAARLAMPVYKPRTFISPGYQDNLGWGFATALGVQDARRDVPVLSITGDGGFLYTATEMSSAVRHKIPLVTVVFNNNSFGNVKLIQQEWYGGRTIASDLTNPDFVKFAESFGAAAEQVETPAELRAALRRGFKRRGGPTLIEMTVGPMPSPWEFIMMPRVRG
jgi:acetolactate synthase-1/2/3 large subunit